MSCMIFDDRWKYILIRANILCLFVMFSPIESTGLVVSSEAYKQLNMGRITFIK